MSQFVRFLFPSFLLAGIAVGLFCAAPFSARERTAQSVLFEVQLSAAADGTVRLTGLREGVNVPESQAGAEVQADGPQTARFVLPAGRYRAFRVTVPGGVKVEGARVTDLAGVERARVEKGRFQMAADGTAWTLACTPPLALWSSLEWSAWQCVALALALTLPGALLLGGFAARGEKIAAKLFVGARDFARRRPVTALFATAAAAAIVSCWPVVFCGKSFVSPHNGAECLYARDIAADNTENPKMSDTGAMMWAHLPYSVLENRALFRDHELPLRLRDNSCGVPLLAQGQAMLGDPLHWIPILAGGATWAWDVKFVLAKILFAFGIGLLVRAAVGRLGVALLLAGSSAFIGFFAYRFNHAAFFSLSYAPWVLLAWVKIVRAPAWRAAVPWVALLAVANGVELNSGTAKEASMLIAGLNFTGLLALLLAPESRAARARKLAAASAGLLIFLLVSAPCWLPFLDALAHAWTGYNAPHAYQIQPALFLGLFDDLFYRQTAPVENHTNPSANFFVLTGVLWALVHARRLATDRLFLALALAAVPLLALVFGTVPPALLTRLPFVGNISHVDNTFSCVLLVLLFPLAGFGLQACRDRLAAAEWRGDWTLMLVFLALLGAAFFGCIQAEPRVAAAISGTGPVVKSAFFIRYATALFLAAALLPWLTHRLWHRRGGLLANALLIALALFAMHFRHGMYLVTKFDSYVMNPRARFNFATLSPALRYVKEHAAEPARAAGFGEVLAPGFNSAVGLESIAGADALASPYYREFLDAAKLPMIWDWRLTFDPANVAVLLPLYDALNLRTYLGMPGTTPSGVRGLQRLASGDLEIFTSPTVWPRAFFTDTLVRYGTAADFARMVWEGDRRPFAAVPENAGFASALPTALPARQVAPATEYRLTGNTTTFAVEAVAAGVAVLTETYEAENFRVTVNGKSTPYFRANHAFLGVPIPQAGHYTVRFEYWPRRLTLALWLSAAGLALLAAGAAWVLASRPTTAA